ncbi:uncharacterized protein PITG_17689 [Phytophthora infestans T30-4]|uniref:Uncharacterized protein n=1 Tax=Phytophthora infestans (strain T30-4) TaxID=403677 RepID=D0NWM3_PHYIT|nr:uncharacterized protein PITG_17689 [Phytophthora infestans T30-4]EEY67086.1 conserved hypothetical protein [Phytophthora infestans T30-4]|eukprot:XP_002896538.1 conserved hypothetical protein [Phytophthora infestans T30-4]
MIRRGSSSSLSSSSSDVNFDDVDDHQVFGYLEDDDDSRLASPGNRPRSPSADFRLNFSPRINASIAPPRQTTRKSNATAKPRSPPLTAKKSIVKGQSSLTPVSKISSHKRENSSANVLHASIDSDRCSFFELAPARVAASKAAESGTGTQPLRNTDALVAALVSLQTQVELLATEKSQLEGEVITARTAIENLEQKVVASELSSDLFARQLANVKESFQAKLMAREEEVALEKMTLGKEKETQLQHQQARFSTEAVLWKHEIAALTKVKLELENESDRLNKVVDDEKHTRISEELQILSKEKKRFELVQIEIQELKSELADDTKKHEVQRQQLEAQKCKLLLDKKDEAAEWERERHVSSRQNEKEKAKLLRFAQEVRGLHHLLQLSVVETRKLFNFEVKKVEETLQNIQQQASELAVHHSDRDMALMSRNGRILQLESQRKNDRQTIKQLEATLVRSTRVLEKKYDVLKAKYEEQKEHLEITLAVRQGLTTDLQAKRKQVTELERDVARLTRAKGKTDVTLKHSQQQIIAMQKVHAHELGKLIKRSPASKIEHVTSSYHPQEECVHSRAFFLTEN